MGNTAVGIFIAVAAILGFIPVFNPFKQLGQLEFRFCSILTVTSLFNLVYPIVFTTDVLIAICDSPFLVFTFSHRFIVLTLLSAGCVCNTIVRLAALWHCSETVKFVQTCVEMKNRMTCAWFRITDRERRCKWLKRTYTAACGLWVLAFPVRNLIRTFLMPKAPPPIELSWLPSSEWASTLLVFLSTLSVLMAPAYALIFTIFGGIYLLDLFDGFHQILTAELEGQWSDGTETMSQNPPPLFAVRLHTKRTPGGSTPLETERANVFKEFGQIQSLFSMCDKIGGWYLLAMVVLATAGLTEALCITKVLHWAEFTAKLDLIAEKVTAVLLLAFFGDFYKHSVRLTLSTS